MLSSLLWCILSVAALLILYLLINVKVEDLPKKYWVEYGTLLEKAKSIGISHYYFCRDVINREIPDFLKEDKHQIAHACANVYVLRGGVLEEALKTGYLSYFKNDKRKMLGAYLFID